jgi:hypothetical protein
MECKQSLQTKRCRDVKIRDLTLMRMHHNVNIGAPKLGKSIVKFYVIGPESNCTLGELSTNDVVNDESWYM